jgi:CBS domain-containing protein
MQVKDLCRAPVVTVDAGQSLASAARRMVLRGIGSLAVLDDGQLAGILTERDLARAVADDADMATTPVGYYASVAPPSATSDEDAQAAAGRMLGLGVRHLPVVDRGQRGQVVAMLSMRDLLVLVAWQPVQMWTSSLPEEIVNGQSTFDEDEIDPQRLACSAPSGTCAHSSAAAGPSASSE